jgi:hypothetical protein
MRKYLFTLSIGFAGADHEEDFEYPEEDFAGMTEAEIEKRVEGDYLDWRGNYLDGWFERVDE